jgi:hypothetical protein
LRALSLCTCCRHYPGTATGGTAVLIRPVISAFPGRVAGSACASSFSRLTQRSLALRPAHSRCHQFVARLPEGFRHFVTSMPAPVASGWSGCRVGLAPTGKRRLFTAHTHCGPTPRDVERPRPVSGCREDADSLGCWRKRPRCSPQTPRKPDDALAVIAPAMSSRRTRQSCHSGAAMHRHDRMLADRSADDRQCCLSQLAAGERASHRVRPPGGA